MPETAHQLALSLETHRNHYLFSDYYLNGLLPRQAPWREAETEAQQALEAITARYHEVAEALPHYNEAAAEQEWIRPVLDLATDRLIDRIVYRLYGLTEEEIAVVEGRLNHG